MNWRSNGNNRYPSFYDHVHEYGNNSRNNREQREHRNRNNYPNYPNYPSPSPQYYADFGYTASVATYEYDVHIVPQSRGLYSYHNSDVQGDGYTRGFRAPTPYEEETRFMRGFRTYDPYDRDRPYDDPYGPGPSNAYAYQPRPPRMRHEYYPSFLQYAYDHRMGVDDHRMGDHRFADHRFADPNIVNHFRVGDHRHGDHRYGVPHYGDHHLGGRTGVDHRYVHVLPEQRRYPTPSPPVIAHQPRLAEPRPTFPYVHKTRVTYPTKSSLRQPRDDLVKTQKKVTFKKRPSSRKISPEPEKKWCNLFRKKKNSTPKERGPTPAEYFGASEEREWY